MGAAGSLNKRMTWQYKTVAKDDMGGFVPTYVEAIAVFCDFWKIKSNEKSANNLPQEEILYNIRIRYLSVFSSSWRGLYKGRFFDIVGINNVREKNEFLDITCKEVK